MTTRDIVNIALVVPCYNEQEMTSPNKGGGKWFMFILR